MKTLYALALACFSQVICAQMTPVGVWHTIDDTTKEIKSEVTITQANGVLTGKITKLLKKDAKQDAICTECSDDRKDKPVLGMEIIRGAKKTEGKEVWEGGKILDPENGKSYTLKLTPMQDGKELEVRGYIAFFSRGQQWVRAK